VIVKLDVAVLVFRVGAKEVDLVHVLGREADEDVALLIATEN
jgi:hypothetical protein